MWHIEARPELLPLVRRMARQEIADALRLGIPRRHILPLVLHDLATAIDLGVARRPGRQHADDFASLIRLSGVEEPDGYTAETLHAMLARALVRAYGERVTSNRR